MAATMQDVRRHIELLRKLADGDSIKYADLQAASWVAEGKLLDWLNQAHLEMQQWLSDEDIRERDPEYAAQRKARLSWLAGELQAEAEKTGAKS